MKPKTTSDHDFCSKLRFEPLSRNNWHQFVTLFGPNGACGNCWCMSFRLSKPAFDEGKINNGNRESMRKLVWQNKPTGLLGLYEDFPIAWCAFAPREDFTKLKKSRVHKRIDDLPVWSVPCTFIAKEFRRQGVSVHLLKGLIEYATKNGIQVIEAYPTIPTQESIPDAFAWIGLYKSFQRAGFKIVDTTSKSRPMVRYYTKLKDEPV